MPSNNIIWTTSSTTNGLPSLSAFGELLRSLAASQRRRLLAKLREDDSKRQQTEAWMRRRKYGL